MLRHLLSVALMVLCTVFINACQSNFPTIPPANATSTPSSTTSIITLCGAGLEKGLAAQIEAEYSKLGGKISAGFQDYVRTAIFSRSDIVSADKQKMYDKYIECVLKIDERNRVSIDTCAGRCDALNASCIREHDKSLGACIERMRYACINECTGRYGRSLESCVQSFCDPRSPINISQWSERQCRSYRTRRDSCEGDLQSCIGDC